MAHFLLQVAYTAEGWAALVQRPHNRLDEIRPVVERLGGSVDNLWASFGDYDVVVLLQLPDNVSAAAFSIAVSAGGAVRAAKTTPLMSVEEGMDAMRRAGDVGYTPPAEWGKHSPPPTGVL
jgi:uncharacterized protein with GYD domain